jgi:hypothetical protein
MNTENVDKRRFFKITRSSVGKTGGRYEAATGRVKDAALRAGASLLRGDGGSDVVTFDMVETTRDSGKGKYSYRVTRSIGSRKGSGVVYNAAAFRATKGGSQTTCFYCNEYITNNSMYNECCNRYSHVKCSDKFTSYLFSNKKDMYLCSCMKLDPVPPSEYDAMFATGMEKVLNTTMNKNEELQKYQSHLEYKQFGIKRIGDEYERDPRDMQSRKEIFNKNMDVYVLKNQTIDPISDATERMLAIVGDRRKGDRINRNVVILVDDEDMIFEDGKFYPRALKNVMTKSSGVSFGFCLKDENINIVDNAYIYKYDHGTVNNQRTSVIVTSDITFIEQTYVGYFLANLIITRELRLDEYRQLLRFIPNENPVILCVEKPGSNTHYQNNMHVIGDFTEYVGENKDYFEDRKKMIFEYSDVVRDLEKSKALTDKFGSYTSYKEKFAITPTESPKTRIIFGNSYTHDGYDYLTDKYVENLYTKKESFEKILGIEDKKYDNKSGEIIEKEHLAKIPRFNFLGS